MRTVAAIPEIRAALDGLRGRGTVGLVPTMGAFHDGHLSLMRAARDENDLVVVSIFVNPSQFAADEDLASYPREPDRDLALAHEIGVDLVFTPDASEMYPPGFQTWVEVEELGRGLEGDARPGHFRGVATVCLKVFSIVRPNRAYFGQKDAQQVAVVEQMVRDLALDLEIRVLPTVRDTDGLALSSRNRYLTPDERSAARALPRALAAGAETHRRGGEPEAAALAQLEAEPAIDVDYLDVRRWNGRLVLAAAVRIGDRRLIDNVVLEGEFR
jgi:pantoate--beta-alanine ligase